MTDRKPKVLVCEDNTATRTVLKFNFHNAGFDVTAVPDGVEGWQRLQCEQFDAVITDQQMPEMLGVDLCRRIRRLPGYDNVPLILLTAKSFELDRKHLQEELRVFCELRKPFSPSQLIKQVKDMLAVAADA